MKKKKWPDGFPCEVPGNDENPTEAHCDNCNEVFDANEEGILAKAVGNNGAFHKYAFCCYDCACEFSQDNGEMFIDRLNDSSPFNISFRLNPNAKPDDDAAESSDPVADAVKSIMTDEPTAEPDAAAEPTDEQPALVDDVHERKAAECLKEVVKRAMEISDLSSKISSEKEYLKSLQKEYDTLVKRQQEYILENANGIQLTFSDCDPTPDAGKTGQPAAAAEEPADDPNAKAVDTMGWRMTPSSQLPIKLTEKQWAAVDAAFPTLGDLQDWLCQDRREKVPGVSQTVYDKLVDALNDYVTEYTSRALNQEKTDEEPADETNDD